MAVRDVAMAWAAYEAADERTWDAFKKARGAGASNKQLEIAIQRAANGKPRIARAIERWNQLHSKAHTEVLAETKPKGA